MKLHLEVRDDNGHTVLAPDIIEIPEGATWINMAVDSAHRCWRVVGEIPIPRPKVKVMRFKWYIVDEDDVSDNRYTTEEARNAFDGYKIVCIRESGREEEE